MDTKNQDVFKNNVVDNFNNVDTSKKILDELKIEII